MEKKPIINLKDISLSFDGEKVLEGLNLSIYDGEFVTLLGPSGCGKTTTLRIIGGFLTPDSGDVFFGANRVNDLPPYKRPVNTIFQRYALFPHLNVYDNVAFGMRVQKKKKAEIAKTVERMLEMVNLKGFEKRTVSTLSGGQQQRVAIARALANDPKVLLLDEPLAALDLKLRKDMQNELKNMQKSLGITFIYVTHDQEEALSMSDTVVVMDGGEIQQIGSPLDIYNEPVNAFVAADGLIIPMQCEYFALEGLSQLTGPVKKVRQHYNPNLTITGILLTMYNGRLNLTAGVVRELKKYYADKLFKEPISRSVRLSEAPSYGEPICYHEPYGKGALEYQAVAKELLGRI